MNDCKHLIYIYISSFEIVYRCLLPKDGLSSILSQNIPIRHHTSYLGGHMAMVTLHHWYSLSVSLHCWAHKTKSQLIFSQHLIETPSLSYALVYYAFCLYRGSIKQCSAEQRFQPFCETWVSSISYTPALEGDFNAAPSFYKWGEEVSLLLNVLHPRTHMMNSYPSLIPEKTFCLCRWICMLYIVKETEPMQPNMLLFLAWLSEKLEPN